MSDKKSVIRKLHLLLVATLLAGCSSSSDTVVKQYLLPTAVNETIKVDQPFKADLSQPYLVVRPVKLTAFLNGHGIVYQTSPSEIVQARYHQWANDLSAQLTQRIINELRSKQNVKSKPLNYWPIEVDSLINQSQADQLQINLTQFNGNYQGEASIQGEWQLVNHAGKILMAEPIKMTTPLAADGYEALVDALSDSLNKVIYQLASSLSATTPPK
ncbi:hypothetical protein BS333_08590 [Vibrio azureus]|uniref:ABC-type transport auxiliary lipoprotein component domain-containing protein n=1 Tax=Vibrio azureus NBRC 104587 TaxID=1219077 RepID=U3AUY4_9VIBR|nr:ABC-type transport auxiliary lipoprotein family protein [Vibrio azureus]AUI86439.1 hypothetical protein BS333_08590 [Vibrio azureus]GAD77565.1 hypothetical protein VAZ01S_080_00150 [Vibrio azureus NBRC 104587]